MAYIVVCAYLTAVDINTGGHENLRGVWRRLIGAGEGTIVGLFAANQ